MIIKADVRSVDKVSLSHTHTTHGRIRLLFFLPQEAFFALLLFIMEMKKKSCDSSTSLIIENSSPQIHQHTEYEIEFSIQSLSFHLRYLWWKTRAAPRRVLSRRSIHAVAQHRRHRWTIRWVSRPAAKTQQWVVSISASARISSGKKRRKSSFPKNIATTTTKILNSIFVCSSSAFAVFSCVLLLFTLRAQKKRWITSVEQITI